jgi:hypothetical protein
MEPQPANRKKPLRVAVHCKRRAAHVFTVAVAWLWLSGAVNPFYGEAIHALDILAG